MGDFFETNGITREARISIILNTFMYADKCVSGAHRISLKSVVEQLLSAEHSLEDSQRIALRMVRSSLNLPDNEEVGKLMLTSFSEDMDRKYRGAYAATFVSPDGGEVYVVFRGTGSGRWYDNGDALSTAVSDYQRIALKYFEDSLNELGLADSAKLVVTGHSKGGNLAQFVTLRSKKGENVSLCISFDGQGFSPEFLSSIGYPSLALNKRIKKMYSVCGDNDYVNVLGKKVISDKNTIYIKTLPSSPDLYSAHSIIPQQLDGYDSHWCDFLYDFENNRFNEQTREQRELAKCSAAISTNAMELPREKREDMCRTVMTFLEKFIGGSGSNKGLNGEAATVEESVGFCVNLYEVIIPLVSHFGQEAKDDLIYRIIVKQKDGADDESALSKLKYMMSNPKIIGLYCLGVVIVIENFADIIYNEGYAVGRMTAPELKRAIMTVLDMYNAAVKLITSHKEKAKKKSSLSDILGGILKALTKKAVDVISEETVEEEEQPDGEWYDHKAYDNKDGKRVLEGTDSEDYIVGKDVSEVIKGYGGNDGLHGYGGNDEIYGGDGDDALYGENGDDSIYGEGGNDFISGGSGNDYLEGGEDDDNLKGNGGNDIIHGGNGNDTLDGGEGNDVLSGEQGNDRYVFSRGFGSDVINDTQGKNIIEFKKITPDELRAEVNSSKELIIEVTGTSDRVRVRDYSSKAFAFVIDGKNYKLAEKDGSLEFVMA